MLSSPFLFENDFEFDALLTLVKSQIMPSHVNDARVIDALLSVPRSIFLPPHLRGIAYAESSLSLSPSRHLLMPVMFARMLQIASIQPKDLVLDVGCARGYSTAVLAQLAARVFGVESDPTMVEEANFVFKRNGLTHAVALASDPLAGFAQYAPFHVIVCTLFLESYPEILLSQLREGGRLVAVMKCSERMGSIMLWEKRMSRIVPHRLDDVMLSVD